MPIKIPYKDLPSWGWRVCSKCGTFTTVRKLRRKKYCERCYDRKRVS